MLFYDKQKSIFCDLLFLNFFDAQYFSLFPTNILDMVLIAHFTQTSADAHAQDRSFCGSCVRCNRDGMDHDGVPAPGSYLQTKKILRGEKILAAKEIQSCDLDTIL